MSAEIVVNINIDAGEEKPKVEVKKVEPKKKKPMSRGGVLQFPAMPVDNNPVLDMMGIREV